MVSTVHLEPRETEKAVPLGKQKVGEIRDGKILLPSGRLHVVKGITTNNFHTATRGAYEIFEHHTDNAIASILTIKPGEGMIGTINFKGRFKDAFLESLKQPITVSEDDTDEQKELKRAVSETRQELKQALDRGEDIEQIMNDARVEAQRLAIYRAQLKEDIDKFVKEHPGSTQDMEDMVNAANKMLEEHGIAPIKYGPLVKQKFLMMRKEKGETK